MCGRFMHGLSEWSNNTPETLKYTAASTIANGGSFYLIDRQLPNGDLEERSWPLLKEVLGFVDARRDLVTDTVHVPETAILFSLRHIVGDKNQFFPDMNIRKERQRQFSAIANMFRNRGHHYTALNEDTLKERIFEYKLVILPEIDYLDEELKELLKQYVERGGKLLIVQSDGEMEYNISELAGVKFERKTELNYGYISYKKAGISDPVMVRSAFSLVKPLEGTELIHSYVQPLSIGSSGVQFGHGYAPPTENSEFAAVTRRNVGQGEVIFVAAPVLTSFEVFFNPHITNLIIGLVDTLLPEPLVKLTTPAQVEMVAVRKADDLIVHLVNHSGKEILAGWWCPVVEFIPELYGLKLSVKENLNAKRYLEFDIPKLKIMESIRIKEYFKQ